MRSRDDYIGHGQVPTVLEAQRRSMAWVDDAACARPPYDSWKWVLEPSAAVENAGSVVKLFEVCAGCPVRRQCLVSALGEDGWTVMGAWGGTVMSERRTAMRERMAELKPDPTFRLSSTFNKSGTVSAGIGSHRLTDRDRLALAVEVADSFEASFEDRLQGWRRREKQRRREHAKRRAVTAAAPLPARSCRRCGERLEWWQRSDTAYCSAACKQAAYRAQPHTGGRTRFVNGRKNNGTPPAGRKGLYDKSMCLTDCYYP